MTSFTKKNLQKMPHRHFAGVLAVQLILLSPSFVHPLGAENNVGSDFLVGEWTDSRAEERNTYFFLEGGNFYFQAVEAGNWENGFFGASGNWRVNQGVVEINTSQLFNWDRPIQRGLGSKYNVGTENSLRYKAEKTEWREIGVVNQYVKDLTIYFDLKTQTAKASKPRVGFRLFSSGRLVQPVSFVRVGDLGAPTPDFTERLKIFLSAIPSER